MKNFKKRGKGFTITELLVVIAIIGILAIVLIPKFGSMIGDAKETGYLVDAQTVKTIVTKSVISDNTLPNAAAMNTALTEAGYTVAAIDATQTQLNSTVYDGTAFDIAGAETQLLVHDSQDNVDYIVWFEDSAVYMIYPNLTASAITATSGNTGIAVATAVNADIID